MSGLYDLVREYFDASPERRKEIEAEREKRFPLVTGWPQRPDMIFVEVGPNTWVWSLPMFGVPYIDNDGNIVRDEPETDLFTGAFERLKSGEGFAHPAADFLRLNFALMLWPPQWKNSFYVEIFGSFRLKSDISFDRLGVVINGRREFGRSNFGARWFYSARVSVPSRDLNGFLDGIERLERALQQAAGDRYLLFAKVRALDLVWLPKGTPSRQGHMNRVQSKHVDFVLCSRDVVRPLVAIELDDASHERDARRARDEFLDAAFRAAGLPLLHFPCKARYDVDEVRRRIAGALGQPSSL